MAIGPPRIEDRVGGRQLIARQVVIGDDDIYPIIPCRLHRIHRRDPTVTRYNQACSDAPSFSEPSRSEIVAVANAVRHERVHRRAGAAENAREHRGAALAVDVVIAVHEDGALLSHCLFQQFQCGWHISPAVRIRQTLQVGSQERLRECRGRDAALHQDRGQRFGNPQFGRERLGGRRIGRGGEDPARGNHSLAYNNTPHASQPSIVAPRWISARRCVGTAVKQLPHDPPCNGKTASGALPRRMRS